jgi:hypothetical protein
MGKETICAVQFGKQRSKGKALLETSEILFRGDFRLKIPFGTVKSARAANGELRVQTAEGLAIFELGAEAEKWLDKILHPKSRIEKLGIKPDARVALVGQFEADFVQELSALTKAVTKEKVAPDREWVFYAANSLKELAAVSKLAKTMKGAAALWIVYPKGQKSVTENDVLTAGRKASLKDVKVVGFSATHTALKFVIPKTAR